MFRFFKIIFLLTSASFASGIEPLNILNFSAVNSGNDVSKQNDTIWVATNGGLAQFQYSSGNFITLHHSNEQFPEISLSALHIDNDGLWIGSENGYLYYRQKNKKQKIYNDLFLIKSKIYTIKSFKDYLIIGHDKGVSVLDKKKGNIISTKRNFQDFIDAGVNLIEIKNDTIWVAIKSGAKGGVAKLENFSKYVDNSKFGDNSPLSGQTPWKTIENSTAMVKTLFYAEDKIKYFENFVLFDDNYRIETQGNDLIKYDDSGNKIANLYLESDINFLKFIDGKIVVGTKFDFSQIINFGNDKRLIVPGLVNNTNIEKLFVDSEQSLWILPSIVKDEWWNALTRIFRGNQIKHYKDIDGMGTISNGCPDFTAITQNGNRMFFGYCGDPLREYNLSADSWGVWVFDIRNYTNYPLFVSDWKGTCNADWNAGWDGYYWLKVDALITDKNGIIWGTYWRDIKLGNVEMPIIFAFHPQKNEFRYLLIDKPQDELTSPNNLALSGKNDLLLGFKGKEELWIIDANKNPFDTTTESMEYRKNKIFLDGKLSKLQTTGSGNVLIGTDKEPVIFTYDKSSKHTIVSIKYLPAERFSEITNDIVLEYSEELWGDYEGQSIIRNVFWIANKKVGVERVVIDEYLSQNGILDSAVYSDEQTAFSFSTVNGSINQNISALAIDSVQNLLWIGGDKGITRIRLPERSGISSQTKIDFVFPNPYLLSKHNFLSIPSISQNSIVDIYTISGKLVKHIDENSAEKHKTIDGTYIYKWKIPQNTAPGTYLIAVKPHNNDKIVNKNTKLYKLTVIP
ncbi:MAG: hypothetical protein LBH98_08555 [Chitinispirillales bacterium]|jgi:hypothetical protein|nr:hypothetical protein [Chitinispirillales bacterium]